MRSCWNPMATKAAVTAMAVVLGACNFPASRDVPQEGVMNNGRLQTLIEGFSQEVEGQPGTWSLMAGSRQVMVLTDENADRMRIMTPIIEDGELAVEEALTLLEANFDRALDARYAVARGYVWAVFIHPLRPLTDSQFVDGVNQVVTLADNYGSSYSSTELVFQGGPN